MYASRASSWVTKTISLLLTSRHLQETFIGHILFIKGIPQLKHELTVPMHPPCIFVGDENSVSRYLTSLTASAGIIGLIYSFWGAY